MLLFPFGGVPPLGLAADSALQFMLTACDPAQAPGILEMAWAERLYPAKITWSLPRGHGREFGGPKLTALGLSQL